MAYTSLSSPALEQLAQVRSALRKLGEKPLVKALLAPWSGSYWKLWNNETEITDSPGFTTRHNNEISETPLNNRLHRLVSDALGRRHF